LLKALKPIRQWAGYGDPVVSAVVNDAAVPLDRDAFPTCRSFVQHVRRQLEDTHVPIDLIESLHDAWTCCN